MPLMFLSVRVAYYVRFSFGSSLASFKCWVTENADVYLCVSTYVWLSEK